MMKLFKCLLLLAGMFATVAVVFVGIFLATGSSDIATILTTPIGFFIGMAVGGPIYDIVHDD